MKLKSVILFFLSIDFLCICACQSPPLLAEAQAAVKRSSAYLQNAVQDDGKFVYTVNLNPEIFIHDFYNFLRHAGAVYPICQ